MITSCNPSRCAGIDEFKFIWQNAYIKAVDDFQIRTHVWNAHTISDIIRLCAEIIMGGA